MPACTARTALSAWLTAELEGLEANAAAPADTGTLLVLELAARLARRAELELRLEHHRGTFHDRMPATAAHALEQTAKLLRPPPAECPAGCTRGTLRGPNGESFRCHHCHPGRPPR